jgi:hypothetical protein
MEAKHAIQHIRTEPSKANKSGVQFIEAPGPAHYALICLEFGRFRRQRQRSKQSAGF